MNKRDNLINCLKCKDPGACCRRFYLIDSQNPLVFTIKESKRNAIKRLKEYNLPFVIREKGKNRWIIGCTQLNSKGRCKIYPNRPNLCKKYKAGTGYLCVHSKKFVPVL
jgi:Fe-S-cluster containining protein